jgi:2-polyprenyl-6-methoxyphenol hydroxylase-like FAD-dependent oxidoreductase
MREAQTEVLVVGAGPVGLWSALLLARAGVQVTVIDRESRVAARSYACALHPNTLGLLQRFDLVRPILNLCRRLERVAFYGGDSQQAQLNLAEAGGEFPFLVILPQSVFEAVLEERLRTAGVSVRWNHRLDSVVEESELVVAGIDELGGTGTGYIVPHWEMVVKNRGALRAQFVIGADGQNSTLRQRLGLEFERAGAAESFAAYEFECEDTLYQELQVVLGATTNVLWPLPGNRYRWTFELVHAEVPSVFPNKERRSARLAEGTVDERIRQSVQRLAEQRAPWFKAAVKDIAWCTEVFFERRCVKQFGCWVMRRTRRDRWVFRA